LIIRKKEIEELSKNIRRIIDGDMIDLRDNQEGVISYLKNDIHTLANLKTEQVDVLEKEKQSLSESLADISHQLKTPLTSMMIMVDLLETAPPEKKSEFLKNIRMSLVRTEWLVSSLLKMAKLEAGAAIFSPSVVPSNELIETAIEPLQILLEVQDQEVEVVGSVDLICDRRWTSEALGNVMKNASEYSKAGSKILIQSGENPICAWISVTDKGEGILSSDLALLFRRYKGSRSDKGYGIGLPLALAIMRSQNGDIEVKSSIGEGSTFTLKFYK
jgi:signal transduction histidine kinase